MKLNAKESGVFARSVYAELEHVTGTDEECSRRRLLRSIKRRKVYGQ